MRSSRSGSSQGFPDPAEGQPGANANPLDALTSTEDDGGRSTWRSLVSLGARYRRRSVTIVVLLFLGGLAEGLGIVSLLPVLQLEDAGGAEPTGVGAIVPGLLDTIGLPVTIGPLLVVIVLGVTLKAVLTMLGLRQAGYASADVAADLRLDLIRALMMARWQHFTHRPLGSLANAVSSEARHAAAFYSAAASMLASILQVAIYTALTIAVAGTITLAALAFGAVMFLALNFLVKMARTAGHDQSEGREVLTARLTDVLGILKPLKAMGQERMLQPLLEEDIRRLNRAERLGVLSSAGLQMAQEALIAAFVALGIYVFMTRLGMPFEELIFIAFLFYRTVTRLGTMQLQYQKLVTPEAAFRAIDSAIRRARQDQESGGGTAMPDLRREVRLEDVDFAYETVQVLQGVDLSIPAGKLTAIVGPSGAGKTTIVDLVIGLHRPTKGEIWIDDTSLADIDQRAWRSKIGYVPQDAVLFNESIFNNVTLGDADVTRDQAEAALQAAEAWDFVSRTPLGLDTPVGERGAQVSGGQRQRIAIARALVRQPELLILDEATTALDPETERAICQTLARLSGSVTILAISHQQAIAEVADHVLEVGHWDDQRGASVRARQRLVQSDEAN